MGQLVDGQREGLSSREAQAVIDVIIKAKWDKNCCIPFVVDPQDKKEARKYKNLQPKVGVTKMKIRVNLAEGTDVRIAVCRIVDIQDPSKDELYARTPTQEELEQESEDKIQTWLYGAAVDKKGRVTLNDGSDPYVEWKHYTEHWKREGENNFYCFKLAFGQDGQYMVASERDYGKDETNPKARKKKEKQCVHMRFTVHIHCPAKNLPQAKKEARRLHRFFRKKTKYYRSYLTTASPKSIDAFLTTMRHRYIFIFTGHTACACKDPGHPKIEKTVRHGKRTLKKGDGKLVPREGFAPDQNKCPTDINTDVFGGCGNKPEILIQVGLGKIGPRRLAMVVMGPQYAKKKGYPRLLVGLGKSKPTDPKVVKPLVLPDDGPRLMMYTATCRSILTTNLGELFTQAGTKYFVGYTYVSSDNDNLCERFFKRWIKGTRKEKARNEFDLLRLTGTFTSEAAARKISSEAHPRIISDKSTALSENGPLAG